MIIILFFLCKVDFFCLVIESLPQCGIIISSRLMGDLLYLDVVTLEGNKYCITGSTKAFFVNSSTGNVLDPRPAKPALEATALIGLLQKLSPKFKKGLQLLLIDALLTQYENNYTFLLFFLRFS